MNDKEINGEPVSQQPCCGIFSAAIAMGKEPQTVFDSYKKMFKKSSRWRGSTYTNELKDFLTNKKVKWSPVNHPRWITVKKFADMYAKPSGVYLVWVSGHVMTLYRGELIDQWHHQPVGEAKKNRCKIESVIQITNPKPLLDGLVCESKTEYNNRVKETKEKQKTEREDKIRAIVYSARNRCHLSRVLKEKEVSDEIDLNKVVSWQGRNWRLVGYNPRARKNPFVLMLMEPSMPGSQHFSPSYEYYGCACWQAIREMFRFNELFQDREGVAA